MRRRRKKRKRILVLSSLVYRVFVLSMGIEEEQRFAKEKDFDSE